MPDEDSGLIPVQDALYNATTARGFEAGQVVFGRFVLVKVLGRGGMGIVWLAHDNQLEQDVAIKVLPDLVMHDREAVTDMKRETKRSLQLNHHNIVRIYDFNQDDKGAGISMEYVDGETLSSAKSARPQGCFDAEEIKGWVEQMCDALAYAHHVAKIVHRDLKPANIMLTKSGTIKVTDFGIARSISDSISRVSMRHATSGTMVYMSPQQSSGAKSSASDDIYALGATIYDLLTGKPPFYSGNIQHQLETITPPRMSERRTELERTGAPIPEHWEKAVAACLEKEASKRPASIRELAALLQLGNATSLVAPPPSEATAKTVTAETKTAAPSAAPLPPVPAPAPRSIRLPVPTLSRAAWRWIAFSTGAIVILAGIGISIPIIIGKGSIAVNTDPAGAQVTMDTQSMASPATFSQIWSGAKVVSVSLAGYDSVQLPVKVMKNQVADLGVVALHRSTGEVELRTIPAAAGCTFLLIESPVAGEADDKKPAAAGHTPYKSPQLPTGKYNLVVTASDFPDHTQTIEVKPNDNLSIVTDLIKENSLHLLGPDALAAVSLDQPVPANLVNDPATKTSLIEYYQSTERGYTQVHEFKLAEEQLDHLKKDLGVDTTSPQKQLSSSEDKWQKSETASFDELLEQNRFYSAGALLDDEDAQGLQANTVPLRDALAKAKTAHEQKIDKTLSDIAALQSAGKADEAYQLAVSQAAHSGEDVRLTQELATLELAMPSTFDRVSTRFKSMDGLLTYDPEIGQQAEYMRLYDIFKKNLDRHQDYQSRISALESTIGGYNSRIASARAEIKHNQDKANGYHAMAVLGFLGGIAGAAANSTPGAVGGFGTSVVGANGANAREGDIHALQGEVESLESQRQPSEDQLDALKKEYADFSKTLIGEVQ